MSNVTPIYDAIKVAIEGIFTGVDSKVKIPNPYLLEENPLGLLKNSYGIAVGASESPPFEFCSTLQRRAFDIVLMRELVRLDSDTTIFENTEKLLLEDLKLLIDRFELPDQIGVESNIENIDVGSCTGIEYLAGDDERFITITQTFFISWSELIGA